jgi:hypothetical protein
MAFDLRLAVSQDEQNKDAVQGEKTISKTDGEKRTVVPS